jgi:hypothetical protein
VAWSAYPGAIIATMLRDLPLTKRQLGMLIAAAGVLAAVAAVAVDLVGAGSFRGIGPTQLKVLCASALIVLFGLSFLPAGSRPA